MKSKNKIWIAGITILLAGMGIFAIHKTKKFQIKWDLDDTQLGEEMCQNCRC